MRIFRFRGGNGKDFLIGTDDRRAIKFNDTMQKVEMTDKSGMAIMWKHECETEILPRNPEFQKIIERYKALLKKLAIEETKATEAKPMFNL